MIRITRSTGCIAGIKLITYEICLIDLEKYYKRFESVEVQVALGTSTTLASNS